MSGPASEYLDTVDWRRRVFALYAAARAGTDPEASWLRWRAGRDDLFASHPASPLEDRSGFGALPYYPYDPALRFTAPVVAADPARLDIATSDDGGVRLDRVGRVELPIGALDVWSVAGYAGGVFVPFADATNRGETYGGGRYLLDTIKGADLGGADGEIVLDFNFAYHPSCRYSPRWACPLAPAGNRVAAAVPAGERL